MATLLSVLQDACDFGGFPRPTSIINNTDATTRQLLAIANERGIEAVRMFDWPQLTKLSSLTLIAGTNQTLPADCAELLDSTAWYTGDMSPLRGPITPQEWQYLTQTSSAGIKFAFRVTQSSKASRAVAMHPTPAGTETISLFYRSKTWIKPQDWVASMSVTAGMWVFSDGEYWTANTSGTAGTTAPTVANNGADGTITWTRKANVLYERFVADTDEPLIESSLLMKGILARFYRMKGLEYQDLEAEYLIGLRNDLAERNGGRTSNMFRHRCGFLDTTCRDVGFIGGASSTPVTPVEPTEPVYPGALFGFGDNSYGQLTGAAASFPYPTNIIAGNDWIEIECEGYFQQHWTLAIKSDRTLWGWGKNSYGQLGDGTTTDRNQPVQIGTDTNWAKISAGLHYSLGIKTDGSLWIWGGDGNNLSMFPGGVQSLVPIQIGTGTNWKDVFGSQFFSLALKTDNTLWGWGGNYYGWLGQGNQTPSSNPIQISGTWAKVATSTGGSYGGHVLAVKSDGTLWGWGDASSGQITTGGPGYFYSPTQIGTDTNWVDVGCSTHISHAIKTDGKLYSWGNTITAFPAATLGLNGTISATAPTQVGTATNWQSFAKIGVYSDVRHAFKTNGQLWGWGATSPLGYIGDGTQSSNVPVLISQLPNIRKASTGAYHGMFIQG